MDYRMELITNIATKKNNSIAAVYDNLTISKIRKAVYDGDVKAEKYILLYLYDEKEKEMSEEFLNEYGVRLNNRLKADIPLFTIYTEKAFKKWNGKLAASAQETLKKQFEYSADAKPRYEIMKDLACDYKVNKCLPALVVIDGKGKDGYSEIFTSVSFHSCSSAWRIFERICKVLDAIENNPNDFEAIRAVCENKVSYSTRSFAEYYEQASPDSFYNFLHKKIKEKGDSIDACAVNIGLTRNTLSDFMNGKHRIKPENLFALAFHLGLKPDELSWLFCDYSTASPGEVQEWKSGKNERYLSILRFLEQGVSEYDINGKLKELGKSTIKPFEKIEE